ncbi:MAG: hypothetical protein EZS28_043496, partial [Streblomastix strix]
MQLSYIYQGKGKQVILQEILEVDEENRKSILIQQGIDPDGVQSRCVFNMNETMLPLDIKEKIVRVRSHARAVKSGSQSIGSHVTLCATVSPGPRSPPPLFIFGKLVKVPEAMSDIQNCQQAYFDVSESGWINSDIFQRWTIQFSTWVHKQRDLGYFTNDEAILLIQDGHSSRNNRNIHDILQAENIRAVTLPGALTQFLQPLDVAIFHPFRAAYGKQISGRIVDIRNSQSNNQLPKLTEEQKRRIIVESAIDALQQATTARSRQNAFLSTG